MEGGIALSFRQNHPLPSVLAACWRKQPFLGSHMAQRWGRLDVSDGGYVCDVDLVGA